MRGVAVSVFTSPKDRAKRLPYTPRKSRSCGSSASIWSLPRLKFLSNLATLRSWFVTIMCSGQNTHALPAASSSRTLPRGVVLVPTFIRGRCNEWEVCENPFKGTRITWPGLHVVTRLGQHDHETFKTRLFGRVEGNASRFTDRTVHVQFTADLRGRHDDGHRRRRSDSSHEFHRVVEIRFRPVPGVPTDRIERPNAHVRRVCQVRLEVVRDWTVVERCLLINVGRVKQALTLGE